MRQSHLPPTSAAPRRRGRRPEACGMKKRRTPRRSRGSRSASSPARAGGCARSAGRRSAAIIQASASCTSRRPAARASPRSGASSSGPASRSPATSGTAGPSPGSASATRRCAMALILRDPLERTISGFNSRLRQGRPTYTSLWKPAEAVAFAQFPDVRRYLDALIADDEWSLSACAYARRHVTHLRWNYRYYFRSAEAVRENAGAHRARRPDRGDRRLHRRAARRGRHPGRARSPGSTSAGTRRRSGPASVLAGYSDGDIARMRDRLAERVRDLRRAASAARPASRAAPTPGGLSLGDRACPRR